MKFIKSIYIFSALLILLLSYAGCKEDELFPPLSGEEPRNIAQLTAETSSLSILSGALSRVNLD